MTGNEKTVDRIWKITGKLTDFFVKLIRPSDSRTRPIKLEEPQAASNIWGVYRAEREDLIPHQVTKGAHLASDNDI